MPSSFLKETFKYLSSSVVAAGIPMLALPILTKILGPKDFGIIAVFTLFGSLCAGLLGLGLPKAVFRFYFKYEHCPARFKLLSGTIFSFLFLLFTFFFIALLFGADIIKDIFFQDTISPEVLQISFLYGAINLFNTCFTHLLVATKEASKFSFIHVMRAVLDIALAIYLIHILKTPYMGRIYAHTLVALLTCITLFWVNRHLIKLSFSFFLLKKAIAFSSPQVPMMLMGITYSALDKTFLAKYHSLTVLGYYAFAEKFSVIIKFIMDSLAKSWSPRFFELAKKESKESKEQIVDAYLGIQATILTLSVSLIFFSEELIKILASPEYYEAVKIVPIHLFYYVFPLVNFLSTNQILYAEKIFFMAPAQILGLFINALLNILLIPKYGALGAAYATAAASFLNTIVLYLFANKAFPLPIKHSKIILPFAFTLIWTVIGLLISESNFHWVYKIFLKGILLLFFGYYCLKNTPIFTSFKKKLFQKWSLTSS